MWIAFVAAVGGIGFDNVAVSGFQDIAFVDLAGSTIIGDSAENNGIFAVLGIDGAEQSQMKVISTT